MVAIFGASGSAAPFKTVIVVATASIAAANSVTGEFTIAGYNVDIRFHLVNFSLVYGQSNGRDRKFKQIVNLKRTRIIDSSVK
jgi:hypothetical protein